MRTPVGAQSWKWTACISILSGLALLPTYSLAVKEHDFKKCNQSGFCKRNREYADNAAALGSSWIPPYSIDAENAVFENGQLRAVVIKSTDSGDAVRLPLTISFLQSGTARVTMDEERRQNKDIELRHNSRARKERYDEAENLVIVGDLSTDKASHVLSKDAKTMKIQYGPESKFEAAITFSPLEIHFKRDGKTQIKLNDQGLLNMEHWRPQKNAEKDEPEGKLDGGKDAEKKDETKEEKEEKEEKEAKSLDDSTWWEESFGGNTDSKPRGPESVALDISFTGYEHVYGIPSHAGPLSLKKTRGDDDDNVYSDPYRLYNSDVFEYVLDSPMTLYGSIPLIQAHRKDSTVGVFWLNAAETWVDITKRKDSVNPLALGLGAKTTTHTHWISEAGLLDLFVFLGPAPKDVTRSYGELTGYTAMPQEFALGYHQCRWNYVSDEDVKEVDRKMDKFNIPYDVIWLDIEYTHEKKYFTFDPDMFVDPIGMGQQLDSHGRKLVTIIDPHIKNVDYPVSKEMKAKKLAVRNKDGNIFDGWCWPGSSNWVDTFNPAAVEWWKSLFKYDNFKGTMENTFIWNDMNEPSVFNGPETTMSKDNLHFGDWEHRDVHNLMGMTFHNATYEAMVSRKKGELRRPFILTRSFFAGSQRLGAMWTGDNQASWDHLGASIPMILSQGISGFPFAGADVGGFFGNPDKDLVTRWYQAGAFYPFFRGHAHIDARRREPYLLGQPYTALVTAALRLRYSLLPSWYTAFYHAHRDGSPILRPMFWTHPQVEGGFEMDDQFFVGDTGLLAKPVVNQAQETVDIWIPDSEVYYDYFTYEAYPTKAGGDLSLQTPLDRIPLLMRGGHVIVRRDRPRRSTALMRFDPYTLVICISRDGSAQGELYVDDGDSFDYARGQYLHRQFTLAGWTLTNNMAGPASADVKEGEWMKAMRQVEVDRVIIVGAPAEWQSRDRVRVSVGTSPTDDDEHDVEIEYVHGKTPYVVINGLGANIGDFWTVKFL